MSPSNHIRLVVGFDQREAVAYHTFCQSVIKNASRPVAFIPLAENMLGDYRETHTDGSNKFIYTRFLTPYLCEYSGWAIFADGDMICQADIKELWQLRDDSKAVLVVKHDYKTTAHRKYFDNKNEDYPRKNWSSVVLWNCAHPANQILTPEFIQSQTGSFLHRFSWLQDDQIGQIPREWNWLAVEYPDNPQANLVHYTLGAPCLNDYKDCSMSKIWHNMHSDMSEGMGS